MKMSVRVIRKSLLSVVTVTLPAEKKLMLQIYAKRMKINSRISSLCSHSSFVVYFYKKPLSISLESI